MCRQDPDHAGCKSALNRVKQMIRLEEEGDEAAGQNNHALAAEKVRRPLTHTRLGLLAERFSWP